MTILRAVDYAGRNGWMSGDACLEGDKVMKISCGVKVEENEEEAEEDWLWGWERDRDWMSWTREVR